MTDGLTRPEAALRAGSTGLAQRRAGWNRRHRLVRFRAHGQPSADVLMCQALDSEQADADLAALVRSAAEPGLKQRISAYRSAGPKA